MYSAEQSKDYFSKVIMSDDLYRELILDLYQHPAHHGELPLATHVGEASNASCGDAGTVWLKVEKNHVAEAKWSGGGCAISTASMEVVVDSLVGKSLADISQMNRGFVLHQLGLTDISPGREKCLTLPLRAIQELKEII